jgi:replicative DNA helicase
MFVYREQYYLEREKPDPAKAEEYAKWQEKMERARGKAEVIIGKVRNGAVDSIVLAFDEKTLTFATLANDDGSRA